MLHFTKKKKQQLKVTMKLTIIVFMKYCIGYYKYIFHALPCTEFQD